VNPLWLVHCDLHVDAEGRQIPCPGHYVRTVITEVPR
jgi:hypothetical protein